MVDIKTLAENLTKEGKDIKKGFPFEVNPIPGDVEVLQIIIEDKEELPIFISVSEEQILCIAYLFKTEEVEKSKIDNLNNEMLQTNINIPLSSFGLIEDQYVIYGSLSVNSSLEDVVHEIEILSSNSLDAIEAMSDYLK